MNKTITIYELLGLVKDGKAPKTIGWYDKFYKDFDKISNNYTNFIYRKLENGDWDLNTLVEVIEDDEILEEEKKIPEKLTHKEERWHDPKDENPISINVKYFYDKEEIGDKINEIIDYFEYLKSKGE